MFEWVLALAIDEGRNAKIASGFTQDLLRLIFDGLVPMILIFSILQPFICSHDDFAVE